jgi:hypothetical protein
LAARVFISLWLCPAVAFAQAYPAPNHSIYFGYWHGDGKFGEFPELYEYTNLYVSDVSFVQDTAIADWQTPLYAQLERAYNANKQIVLIKGPWIDHLGAQTITFSDYLDTVSDFWDNVLILVIADDVDSGDTGSDLDSIIADAKTGTGGLYDHSLPYPLFQANFGFGAFDAEMDPPVESDCLDIVAIDMYMCGNSESVEDNYAALKSQTDDAKNAVSTAGKTAVLIMMAYAQITGCTSWDPNTESLEILQDLAYYEAYNDTNVLAIEMFAYSRPFTGTLYYPNLAMRHRRMGAMLADVPLHSGDVVRGCGDYIETSIWTGSDAICRAACVANNADACEYNAGGTCYIEYGSGCYLEGGHGGWSALVLNSDQMEPDSVIRSCSSYTEWSPVTKSSPNECMSYCIANGANTCEYHDGNGDCFVEFGSQCTVERYSGWHATLLTPGHGG